MNDSYGVLADIYTALAAERTRTMLSEASYDGLAKQGRTARPSRLASGRTHVAQSVRRASTASLHWLRKGQLAGYPDACTTC